MNKIGVSTDSLQAIFFDFDGVLAECMYVKTEAFAQLFETFGEKIVKKIVKHHVENGGISRYVKIKYYYSEYLNEQISEEKLNDIAQQFSDMVVKKVIESPWVDGAKEFLEKYYEIIDLYIITGTPTNEMELIVKKRDMEKYFKGIYGTPDTKPILVKRIINENEYDREKTIYIGDCLSDYHDVMEADISFLGRVHKGTNSVFPNNVPTISDFFDVLK